ncbi:MAG: PRC-barrel domain-containing protein [Rhizobiales bacterium]|nr:PRC-barrel domain-containing protein [Hyphomicrobiales bacterium]
MNRHLRPSSMALIFGLLIVTSAAAVAADIVAQGESPPATPPPAQSNPAPEPSAVVIDKQYAQGLLGKEVRSAANEDMGRVVDVIVDRSGGVRAAIIDFGGFLGVGSRKIAVDWSVLNFAAIADKRSVVMLALTRDQVKAAPEYKDGKPIVVLGAAGSLNPLPPLDPDQRPKE